MNEDRQYRKIVNSWCMYDWANSAFVCTVMAAVFPPFYRSLVLKAGLAENQATAYYGYTASAALLIIALIAPILGAISDYTGGKKRYMLTFVGLGVISTAMMVFIGSDTWMLASLLFIGGNLGFAGSEVFYESVLPHIAKKNDIDQISAKGYAFGYIGGGLMLIINVMWIMKPGWFGMPDAAFAIKASFVSVAIWWAVFTAPFLRHVPEPPAVVMDGPAVNPVSHGFSRLKATFRDIRQYKQLAIFLVAFWIYNDGIGTIIKMATAYGSEIGIQMTDLIIALIITQFVGFPFAILFGLLARKIGAKRSIILALCVYTLISILGYFMQTALHFYLLAFAVGTVQGGSQALSRSLYGAMVPRHKSAEFFGFYSTSSKFAGIIGPLLFGVVSQVAGHSRLSIVSIIVFFIVGGYILTKVDVDEGIRVAREAEKESPVPLDNTAPTA
jgi:UMF1 family MFS transporter